MRSRLSPYLFAGIGIWVSACSRGASVVTPVPAPILVPQPSQPPATVVQTPPLPPKVEPILPPQQAFLAGMMALRSTGADTFRLQRPTFDGRGVIIGILDSGIDPGLPGFRSTTTGQTKIVDLRDFSEEGQVELKPVTPAGDGSVTVGSHTLSGFGRIIRLAQPPYYGGVFRELPLGKVPAADLNGNGRNTDDFVVIVAKATSGWFAMTDTDGDGSLENDVPLYDYSVSAQTFSYAAKNDSTHGLALAVNLSDDGTRPVLDLVFDNSGHGTHVAGIAGGHNMFGINGFDGVAPGAQLLGIKISNNLRGGISVTGSMLRGMNYAADYADRRGLPLILNLSFGVGNETEGSAAMDSLVNEFMLKHPTVLLVISAGNDGPGLSTAGFPGSADLALTTCALFPGVFAQPPDAETPPPPDVVGWWSARGGEVAKPDICSPGVAFSNVPPWHTGQEISGGTSMAAPHVSGLAALLQSALSQSGGRIARAVELKRALVATARPVAGSTPVEQGTGVPNVSSAYRWLLGAHQSGVYRVDALADGGNQSHASGAYRRSGLASGADTIQRFVISSIGGQPAARLLLKSDAPWLRTPPAIDLHGGPETVVLTYEASQLTKPGLYVGTVSARSATDTLAGPALFLMNTIVVPRQLDEPMKVRETLLPGRVARYFVPVPEGSGGLTAKLTVPADGSTATLYIFEPDGKPHRGGASVDAGGKDSATVMLRVNAEDVIAGIYEVTVLAPPNAPVKYSLEVGLATVTVGPRVAGGEVAIRNLTSTEASARVEVEVDGAVRDTVLAGTASEPATLSVPAPAWAHRMIVDVTFDRSFWSTVTDFGLTVFQADGQLVSQGPMNYAFNRQVIKLDSVDRAGPLQIELFPAFAHLRAEGNWTAGVRVAFLTAMPTRVTLPADELILGPSSAGSLAIPPFDQFPAPGGFRPFLRITASPKPGVPSTRQQAW